MNPFEKYLQTKEAQRKTAGPLGRFAQAAGQGAKRVMEPSELGRVGAQAAIVGGAGLLTAGAHKAYLAITKKRDFDNVLKYNPDLVEHQQANPDMFNQHYSSLRSMNPMFAKDPIVAGSYMRQMSMNPTGAGMALVNSLSNVPKNNKPSLHQGISVLQSNANAGMTERKHDFDQQKYEDKLNADSERQQFGG